MPLEMIKFNVIFVRANRIVSPAIYASRTPFIEKYATLSGIFEVVRNAYARRVYVDRAFQKKTNELVRKHIGTTIAEPKELFVTIDRSTIETIKKQQEGKGDEGHQPGQSYRKNGRGKQRGPVSDRPGRASKISTREF